VWAGVQRCVLFGWLAVEGAGSAGACSRAGAGRRVAGACWARVERRGASDGDGPTYQRSILSHVDFAGPPAMPLIQAVDFARVIRRCRATLVLTRSRGLTT
jgi:hypothetical protein